MIRRKEHRRRGAVAVLTAFCLVILMAIVAFVVDIGYVLVGKTDLQRAADAAAHAAVLDYRGEDNPYQMLTRIRRTARTYVADNQVLNSQVTVSKNMFNADPNGDIVVGRIDFDDPGSPMTFDDVEEYNAVRVRIRKTAGRNGRVSLTFARILGYDSLSLEAEATAAIIRNVGGFKVTASGENVPLLPLTIHEDLWEAGLANSNDSWAYDSGDHTINAESDGTPEVVLFPNQTESSGNFGTLNIGISANSTSFLGNQIRGGLTQSDLDYHGGDLKLDRHGELNLSGNPGLSAGLKDDIEAISGEIRVVPIYKEVVGNGNNANYTITKFVSVRIMAVDLTGGEKFVSVQPANLTYRGVIQADPGLSGTSEMIYSPPVIVQ